MELRPLYCLLANSPTLPRSFILFQQISGFGKIKGKDTEANSKQ